MAGQSESARQRCDEILRALPMASAESIVAIVKDDRAPLQALEAAIAANPVFTAHLLSLSNFAAGLPRRVLSLGQAVSLLGLDCIKPLALALLAFDLKPPPGSDDEADLTGRIDLRSLWEHSLGSAVIASRLAAQVDGAAPLRAFTAGFIHDIGRVLLFRHARDLFHAAELKSQQEGMTLGAAETVIVGIDHNAIGADCCRRFDIAPDLQEVVRLHHESPATSDASASAETRRSVALLQAAENACERHRIGRRGEGCGVDGAEPWRVLGLREGDWQEQHREIKQELEAARELFGFPRASHRWVDKTRGTRLTPGPPINRLEEKVPAGGKRAQVIPFPQAPAALAVPEDQSSAHKLVILVVEDHSSLLDMVSLFLMRHGYHVRTANNGESALEILAREEIHLVLLDLMLPKIDGFEVLRQVHKCQQDRFPYIIVASARVADADRQKALDLGANEYLTKPFNLTRLLERVQAVEKFLC